MTSEDLAEPPEPPEAPRRIRLYPFQWVGAGVLAIFPLLAVFGVFGESMRRVETATPTLGIDVRYPSRFRYKQIQQIEIWIRNRSGSPLDTVRVRLDSAYARYFSTLKAIPSFDQAYTLPVTGLAPGEVRLAIVELQAERYGRHTGLLQVTATDTADVRLSTFVFP